MAVREENLDEAMILSFSLALATTTFSPSLLHAGTAPARTMEAATWGHRDLKWEGGAQQDVGGGGTRSRQRGGAGDHRAAGGTGPGPVEEQWSWDLIPVRFLEEKEDAPRDGESSTI